MLMALPGWAVERQHVPATDLVAAAQATLDAKASAAQITAQFALVGHVDDLELAAPGALTVRAGDFKGSWLRPRIGVPVKVFAGDRAVSSATIWFSVTAPAQALVYGANYAHGMLDSEMQTGIGAVDLARTHGETLASLTTVTGQRLRHDVLAGQAVLADDFEVVPAIQAQQSVRIEATSGVVHLTIAGRALSDGEVGQTIAVLPANASQPVRARVMSNQVVKIEN
jgi:flagella basal body P-ring formation protein FlgA